jgi:beta-lactamase superfamily II metal-dependent hydrolase
MHHQSIDVTKTLPMFGDVSMQVLWPTRDLLPDNENNNSVVLALTLDSVCFVLTGDAEAEVWSQIATQIPHNTKFFKVPHHGSDDAMFTNAQQTPWLNQVGGTAQLAISSHIRPFSHPSNAVISLLNQRGQTYYRTDQHYHVAFETDGQQVSVKYSHV